MKNLIYSFCITVLIFFTACSGEKARMDEQTKINELEKKIYANNRVDTKMAQNFAVACKEYAEKFPEDSLAADYIFKAGEVYRTIKLGNEAILCYQKILDEYPSYTKVALCLFFQGFVYSDILKNFPKAKECYSTFISKYPNHDFADDAKALIEYLGKSDAELIQMFEKNQAADTLKK